MAGGRTDTKATSSAMEGIPNAFSTLASVVLPRPDGPANNNAPDAEERTAAWSAIQSG